MRIISIKKGIGYNKRQLINVQEQPPKILPCHGCHVNYVPAVSVYPEITRVYSLETVSTKGT